MLELQKIWDRRDTAGFYELEELFSLAVKRSRVFELEELGKEIESLKMKEEFPQMYDEGYDQAISDVMAFILELRSNVSK